MRNILLLFLLIALYSCKDKAPGNETTPANNNKLPKDSLTAHWTRNFREFRDAVYHNDINKVKTFFSFPVLNFNNEIWHQAFTDEELKGKNMDPDTLIPFTEKDFDRSFKKLFPKEFITSILKVKSDDLFRADSSYTPYFDIDSSRVYQMMATIDREKNILSLNLYFTSTEDSETGGNEYSIGYFFYLKEDGTILFKEIRLAG